MSEERDRQANRLAWAKELLIYCEDAIAAQQRIIERDGALEAYALSLQSLQSQREQLMGEIRELEAAIGQS
ncbi:hypothetical protein TMEC54S_00253 [Thauera mechernichensis]|uniref:hypothetical protein n=1 Tax=Thauera sp. 27 TaxID=305700 RepID=UPI0002CFEBC1|nr:hypothetical protein [Thauera sp. 27]ENO78006.1 hypothetical protein B447_14874 [Thauera sp. 27]